MLVMRLCQFMIIQIILVRFGVEFTLTEVIIMSAPRVLVNGNKLASRIITETKERILEEVETHPAFYSSFPEWRQPRLDILNVGFQDASLSYIKKKIDLASSIGIRFSLHQFLDDPRHPHHPTFQKIITTSPGNFTIRELSSTHHPHPYQHILTLIDQLNQDKQVSSILLQLPLRAELAEHTKSLIQKIDPLKDVDCLTATNRQRCIEETRPQLTPCTPAAVLRILEQFDIQLRGKRVVMAGRSTLVGLPLFHLMLNRGATITLCHSSTCNLNELTREADVVVSAVGKSNLITALKPGGVAIDIGISRDSKGKLCGDISVEAKEGCSLATPVPGGVGPLTVAMLMCNSVRLWKQQMLLERIRLGFEKLHI